MSDKNIVIDGFFKIPDPFGELSIALDIAGFNLEFMNLDERIRSAISRAYGFFLTDKPVDPVSVRVGKSSGLPERGSDDFELRTGPGFSCLVAPYFAGARMEDFSASHLHLFKEDEKSIVFAFENFLRWMMAEMAVRRKGLLFHASAKVVDGEARIFLGGHGTGKSTAVSLTEEGFTIADDVLLVLPGKLGYSAHAMPAVTKFEQKREEIGGYPINGFYKILKAEENRIKKAPQASAFAVLVSSCPFMSGSTGHFAIVSDMMKKCSVYELYFRKEKDFFKMALNTKDSNDE